MDVGDNVGGGKAKNVVTALEVLWVVGEANATEGILLEVVLLNHGAHSAVEDENLIQMRCER